MNRKLDGTKLTSDDLKQIARDAGISDERISAVNMFHNTNRIYSALQEMTAEARLDLFFTGKLRLDTRTEQNQT